MHSKVSKLNYEREEMKFFDMEITAVAVFFLTILYTQCSFLISKRQDCFFSQKYKSHLNLNSFYIPFYSFKDKISLCCTVCSRTHFVDQDALKPQRCGCLCLPNTGVKGIHQDTQLLSLSLSAFFVVKAKQSNFVRIWLIRLFLKAECYVSSWVSVQSRPLSVCWKKLHSMYIE